MNIRAISILLAVVITFSNAIFAEPSYVVLNSFGETISAGEWLSAPTNNICTVGSMPNQIMIGSDGRILVVASGSAKIQEISVSGSTGSVVDEYSLPLGSNPYLMFEENGRIITSLWVSGGIGIIDIASGSVTATDSFCLGPQGVFADSNYIYVTAGNLDPISFVYGEGELWRLDSSGVPIDYITLGINPQQIIGGPDGNLHIVCTGDYVSTFGIVYIVDPASFAVVDSIVVGGSPQRLALDRSTGIIYSATSIWGAYGSGRLLAYDGETHELLMDSDDTGNALSGTGIVGLAAFDSYIFAPSVDSSWIEIVQIDRVTMSLTPVTRHDTGHGPLDVALFDPTGIEEFITRPENLTLSTYPNPFNSAVTISIAVGARPVRIEIFDICGHLMADLPVPTCDFENQQVVPTPVIWQPDASVGSGVYFVRAKIDGNNGLQPIVAKRVVYLK